LRAEGTDKRRGMVKKSYQHEGQHLISKRGEASKKGEIIYAKQTGVFPVV